MKNTSKNWLLAIRPKTLPAAVAPIVAAAALSFASPYALRIDLVILAALCALSLQILVNLANDYSDAFSGVDGSKRLGPVRVTQAGLISPAAMKKAIGLFILLSVISGAPLVFAGGWLFALLGCFCILAALGYSGGKFPLASNYLGEFAVLVFFGLVAVVGASFIFTQHLLPQSWLLALNVGLPISAIMLVNNTRDIPTDAPAKKRTLAVLIGRKQASMLFAVLLATPVFLTLIAAILGFVGFEWLVAAVFSLFFIMPICKKFVVCDGGEFNDLLARTAKFSLLNSLFFSAAILLAA